MDAKLPGACLEAPILLLRLLPRWGVRCARLSSGPLIPGEGTRAGNPCLCVTVALFSAHPYLLQKAPGHHMSLEQRDRHHCNPPFCVALSSSLALLSQPCPVIASDPNRCYQVIDPLPLDGGSGLPSQPEGLQFLGSARGSQMWPLGGTEDGSEATAAQLPKLAFYILTLV